MKSNTVCSVVVLLSAVSMSLAAVGIGRATVHESHPNQCYDAKSTSYFSPGESWPMQAGCGKVTCEKFSANAQLMISFTTCGVAMVQPPCYLVEDNSKPYPECCHQVVCPESNDNNNQVMGSFEEENLISTSNETAPASSENDIVGSSAMHFALGRKQDKFVFNGDERNDLQSLEDQDDKPSEEYSFEISEPIQLPPRFQYATFDDIGNDREQRFNEVDAQEDYQLV